MARSGGGEKRIDTASLRLLMLRVWKHRKAVGLGLLTLVLVDGLQLLVPQIFQRVINGLASGTATRGYILQLGLMVMGIYILMGVCRFVWRYFIIGTSHRIERDLRQELYEHLQTLSPQFYDQTKVGDLMAHATNDLSAVRMADGHGHPGRLRLPRPRPSPASPS